MSNIGKTDTNIKILLSSLSIRAWASRDCANSRRYDDYGTCDSIPTDGSTSQWIAEMAARAALTPDEELLKAFLFELSLCNCTFVPKDAGVNGYDDHQLPDFSERHGGAPYDLRGHLIELIVQYDNFQGDVSFGIKRHVPKGFPPQRRFWFPRVFRHVRRFISEDSRFFVAVRSIQGRAYR